MIVIILTGYLIGLADFRFRFAGTGSYRNEAMLCNTIWQWSITHFFYAGLSVIPFAERNKAKIMETSATPFSY